MITNHDRKKKWRGSGPDFCEIIEPPEKSKNGQIEQEPTQNKRAHIRDNTREQNRNNSRQHARINAQTFATTRASKRANIRDNTHEQTRKHSRQHARTNAQTFATTRAQTLQRTSETPQKMQKNANFARNPVSAGVMGLRIRVAKIDARLKGMHARNSRESF
jgi:hypothetical protein